MGKFFSTGVEAFSATTIRITFSFQGERCREAIQLEPTPANLKRAQQHRALVLDAISKGTFDYLATFPKSTRAAKFAAAVPAKLTFEAYFNGWLIEQKKFLKASTVEGYTKASKQFLPVIGSLPLEDLSRTNVIAWLKTLDVSNKRLANLQSVIRSSLQDAVMAEVLHDNAMNGFTFANKERIKEDDDVNPFTMEEQTAILAHLVGQGLNLIQFAFWTGLRTSELVGLEWGDIDWLRGTVHVRRAFTQAAEAPEVPKTKSSVREVKLLPPALEALIRQKSFTYLAGREVFQNPLHNARWTGDAPIRENLWAPALRRAKVLYRRPYQTRHTYASMMLTAGESPMWVAQQMGHTDWGMIRRRYGKWIAADQPDAGMKAVKMFSAQTKCGQECGQSQPL